ncbi:hypothetical protein C7T94_05305 [Pedobacter yulinensis]|uniref:DUF4890 domain-containing protein n=1 Tax=Pedobacter yulinensis TaxID=2126353 RepID=A0A2T3HP13_9SPHI|nr:hypothetical protein [Pedobacter yulinensis]PST84147.1 hypothetical protein C7T94_05305 [Pedobacter yulinensis]
MKTLVTLAACLLLAAATSVKAQGRLPDARKKELLSRYDDFKRKAGLTAGQSEKVDSVNLKFFKSVSALKTASGSKLQRYKRYKALESERDQDMKAVLNDAQYKEYKRFQSAMKDELKAQRNKQ